MGEKNSKLTTVSAKVPKSVKVVLQQLALDDDRSLSYTIAQLLESHPKIDTRIAKTNGSTSSSVVESEGKR